MHVAISEVFSTIHQTPRKTGMQCLLIKETHQITAAKNKHIIVLNLL